MNVRIPSNLATHCLVNPDKERTVARAFAAVNQMAANCGIDASQIR